MRVPAQRNLSPGWSEPPHFISSYFFILISKAPAFNSWRPRGESSYGLGAEVKRLQLGVLRGEDRGHGGQTEKPKNRSLLGRFCPHGLARGVQDALQLQLAKAVAQIPHPLPSSFCALFIH